MCNSYAYETIEENDPRANEVLQMNKGYWYVMKTVFLPDYTIYNKEKTIELAKLTHIAADIRRWWLESGPSDIIVAMYCHQITPINAKIDKLNIKLSWLNQGNGVEKTEIITDSVSCRDFNKFKNWSFSMTMDETEYIKRLKLEVEGNVNWELCAKDR